MKKFNNHGLDAINSRVCMALALDDFGDDEAPVPNIKSKQGQNRDYTKEFIDCLSYLKKVYNIEELTEKEQNFVISHLPAYSEKVAEPIPAEVIANFCNVIDSNKRLPRLYEAINSKVIEKLSIRFVTEEKMPKADIPIWYPIEYLGYYDSEACQIILCPERIKNAPTVLEEKGIHHDITSQALYGMVFIHALSHAVLDRTNKIDKEGNLVRYDDQYQKIDPNSVQKEEEIRQITCAKFMEESVATIMTLYYYSKEKPSPDQYGVLREWFPMQSLECMIGLEQFDMLSYSNDLIENYCAAWRGRKKALKIYCNKKNELSYLKIL